jgi:branched-chain amino acid transport system substrate-binding protein
MRDRCAEHATGGRDGGERLESQLGRRIELSVKEDAFDPRQAGITSEQLVQERVWGVVGHFYSSSSVAASVLYHEAGVPQVTPTATHPRLTAQGFDNVFRVSGRDDHQALVAADFVLALKARAWRSCTIGPNTGADSLEAFRRELAQRVVAEESLAQGDKDFAAQVARLKGARPDALYFGASSRGRLPHPAVPAGGRWPFVSGDAVLIRSSWDWPVRRPPRARTSPSPRTRGSSIPHGR